MKSWLTACIAMITAAALLTGCGAQSDGSVQSDGKLKVVASFNAMKEFTQAVGKDKVDVVTLIPDGTEPHDFQPTTKNLKELSHARLFVYNGLGMEPWADKTLEVVDNKNLVAVDASKGVQVIANTDKHDIHEHGRDDPHCWLSLQAAQTEVQNIAAALAEADPANADFYRENAAAYNEQLQQVLTEYQEKFQSVPNRQFVTGHAAFAYLCRDFGLTQRSVESVFASGEPSPQQLASLADFCKQHKVTTIFSETMVSPRISETLAKEVGASVKTIHTIESAEGTATYIDRMRDNIEQIYQSLK